MPGSYQPVYNASKSFIQSFAQALHDELRDTAITVTALMPGPTDTNVFGHAKMVDSLVGKMRKDPRSGRAAGIRGADARRSEGGGRLRIDKSHGCGEPPAAGQGQSRWQSGDVEAAGRLNSRADQASTVRINERSGIRRPIAE
nr:SDR family NAD(P)-dependent oxidoreductase [Mycobacterium colombiense]